VATQTVGTFGGLVVTVSERRRYGHTTYTWLRFQGDGIDFVPDPWPCVSPRRSEIERQARLILKEARP